MNDEQIIKEVTEKMTEQNDLYTRMDETKDLIQLDPYKLVDWDGKTTIQQAVSITRNTPAWQVVTMTNKLLKFKWQPVVQSSVKMSDTKIRLLETLSTDFWAQINEYLAEEFDFAGGLDSWLANHILHRWAIGSRLTLYRDKDKNLVTGCVPVDMRWCPYENKEWYCHRTWKSAATIKREHPKNKQAEGLTGNSIECWDHWNGEKERFFVNKSKKIDEKENKYGYPPFVSVIPSTGFMLRDEGYLKHEGEDALFLNKNLTDEMNRAISIAMSLGMDSLFPAMEQETEGNKSDQPDQVPGSGQVIKVKKGERHQRIERGDLNNAHLEAFKTLATDMARGGVTDTEAGTFDKEPGSNVLLISQNELLMEKLKPRIDAIATFKVKAIRMLFDQYSKLKDKGEAELGTTGMKHRYSPDKLGDPSTYRISFRPMQQSQTINLANTALMNAQWGHLPRKFIYRETMQAEDPDRLDREMDMQQAKEADPTIAILEQALKFAEEVEDLEGIEAEVAKEHSRNLTENVVLMRRQRRLSATQPSPLTEKAGAPQSISNNQGLLSLGGLRGGGGDGRRQMQEVKLI